MVVVRRISAVSAAVALLVFTVGTTGASAPLGKCAKPRNQFEGPFHIRARGVKCSAVRHFVTTSPLCHLRAPSDRKSCYDRGWYCRVGPATRRFNYSIPARCTKGGKIITWYAGY